MSRVRQALRFLVDAQLPPALVDYLRSLGHVAEHVFEIGMEQADDESIWRRAKEEGAVLITKDSDFVLFHTLDPGGPPVVWLRIGNATNRVLLAWLAPRFDHILAALRGGERVVEVT